MELVLRRGTLSSDKQAYLKSYCKGYLDISVSHSELHKNLT